MVVWLLADGFPTGMSYIITSGFIGGDKGREDFFELWLNHLLLNPDVKPEKIFVICSRGEFPPMETTSVDFIRLSGDLGHICRDGEASQKHQLEGWACDVIIGALLAYDNECDFIFIEQDCLGFGKFITQMYSDLGDADMIIGWNSFMASAQSLFLVRHHFIPQFVHSYLAQKIADRKKGGEDAFAHMEKLFSGRIRRLSFPFDRDKPKDGWKSVGREVFYAQQLSVAELDELREAGRIE